jgi:hypothetical protein
MPEKSQDCQFINNLLRGILPRQVSSRKLDYYIPVCLRNLKINCQFINNLLRGILPRQVSTRKMYYYIPVCLRNLRTNCQFINNWEVYCPGRYPQENWITTYQYAWEISRLIVSLLIACWEVYWPVRYPPYLPMSKPSEKSIKVEILNKSSVYGLKGESRDVSNLLVPNHQNLCLVTVWWQAVLPLNSKGSTPFLDVRVTFWRIKLNCIILL